MRYTAIFSAVAAAGAYFAFSPVKDVVETVFKHDIRHAEGEVYQALAEGREQGAMALTGLFALFVVGASFLKGLELDQERKDRVREARRADLDSRSSSVVTSVQKVLMPDDIDTPTYLRKKKFAPELD